MPLVLVLGFASILVFLVEIEKRTVALKSTEGLHLQADAILSKDSSERPAASTEGAFDEAHSLG